MGTDERGAVFVQQTAIATHEDVFDFDQQCLNGKGAMRLKRGSVRGSERESLSLPVFATCLVQFGDHGATRAATVLYRNTGSEEV